jgi:hypothetical protein
MSRITAKIKAVLSPETMAMCMVLNPHKRKAENKKGEPEFAFFVLAERTGLEPATPGVTGRYSNQLNYRSKGARLYSFYF